MDASFSEADLEAVERDAYADFWAAAPDGPRARLGIRHTPVGGDGVQLMVAGLGGNLILNRILGYGSAGRVEAAEFDRAVAAFDAAAVTGWAVQVAPSATALAGLAAARGLVPHPRAWMKFARGPEPAAARTALAIRPAAEGDAAGFGAVFCAAFGMPDAIAPWGAALVGRPGWRVFLAWDGDAPVGCGALFLGAGGLGWLGFGGTLASHRGRGSQGAIFAARIEAGRAAGCRGFVTETGVPLPGEAAPSYRNILRTGFAEVYPRPNLRRPPPAA